MLKFEKIEINKTYHAHWTRKGRIHNAYAHVIDKNNNNVTILFVTEVFWSTLNKTDCYNETKIVSKDEWENDRMSSIDSYAETYFVSKTVDSTEFKHERIEKLFTSNT
jgi:hypothetical protein